MGNARPTAGEILQGTLDMLILRTLVTGPAHGHTIAQVIEHTSENALEVEQGSLYPALHRLEDRGLLSVGMGREREQSQGEVLSAHCQGPKGTHRSHQPLASHDPRHRPDSGRIRRITKLSGGNMNLRRFTATEGKDADFAEEIESHLAHEQDTNAARGLSPEEAHRQRPPELWQPATRSATANGAIGRCRGWKTLWRDLEFVAALAAQDARVHDRRHHRHRGRYWREYSGLLRHQYCPAQAAHLSRPARRWCS